MTLGDFRSLVVGRYSQIEPGEGDQHRHTGGIVFKKPSRSLSIVSPIKAAIKGGTATSPAFRDQIPSVGRYSQSLQHVPISHYQVDESEAKIGELLGRTLDMPFDLQKRKL
jgi:hypothetical protein